MTPSNINAETGESILNSSPRFPQWAALLLFTTVTLGSSLEVQNSQTEKSADAKASVACTALAFCVNIIAVGMHMHPLTNAMIVGTKIEALVVAALVSLWAVIISIVSDANNNLAVGKAEASVINERGQTNTVLNGNLYYFSWAGFITIIFITISYLRTVFGVDISSELRSRAARLSLWSGMLASSLIVMGSSINIKEINCSEENDSFTRSFCSRTSFGIVVGTIGVFFSLLVVGLKLATNAAPFVVEGVLSLLLSVLNAFGVAYITSAEGPGSAIGNMYYFSWASFVCAVMLVTNCYGEYSSATSSTQANDQNQDSQPLDQNVSKDGIDFPVEDLPIDDNA